MGHIFTACYPVIASDGTNDILGALCIEIDMEDTYRSIEAINRSSFGIAAAASMIALLLIVISYFYTKKQKSRELHPAAASGTDRKSSRGSQQGEIDLPVQYVT